MNSKRISKETIIIYRKVYKLWSGNVLMKKSYYNRPRINQIAGLILVIAEGNFKEYLSNSLPEFTGYKRKFAANYSKVIQVLNEYLKNLSENEKNFFEGKKGMASIEEGSISDEDSFKNLKIIEKLSEIEKKKGLLRKLVN